MNEYYLESDEPLSALLISDQLFIINFIHKFKEKKKKSWNIFNLKKN